MPVLNLGSGKFGMPLARMQSENLSAAGSPLEAELLDLAEDPQAATAMAHPTATKGNLGT